MDQERQPDFERAEEEAPADFPRISGFLKKKQNTRNACWETQDF